MRSTHTELLIFDRSDTPKDVTASVIDNVQMIHSISKDPNLYKNANEFARNGIEENEFKDPVFLSNGVSLDIQQTTHDNFQITGKIEDELLSDYEVSQNNSINTYSNIPKDVLDRFIDNHGGLKSESLYWTEQGEKWHDQIVTNAQNRQYAMTDNLRVFVTEGPPTAAAYETADHQIAPATLTFRMSPEKNADGTPKYVPLQDRVGVITIAFYDGGRSDGGKYSAAEIMQAILGDKAGGKDGIASSPRGENMTFDTFLHVRRQFEDILNGRDIRDVLAENMVNEMEAESRPSNPLDDLDKDCFENAAEKEEYRAFMEEKYDPIICPKPREFEIGKEEKTDI